MPNSIYKQILDKVVLAIKGEVASGLPEVAEGNIKLVKSISLQPKRIVMPGILVAPYGSKAPTKGATNASDDIPYGVVILVLRVGNQDQESDFDEHLYAEETIRDLFHNKRMAGITGATVYKGEIVNDQTYPAPAWAAQYDASLIQLRFTARVLRDEPAAWPG